MAVRTKNTCLGPKTCCIELASCEKTIRKNSVEVKGAACSLILRSPHPAKSCEKETRKQGGKETSDRHSDFDIDQRTAIGYFGWPLDSLHCYNSLPPWDTFCLLVS